MNLSPAWFHLLPPESCAVMILYRSGSCRRSMTQSRCPIPLRGLEQACSVDPKVPSEPVSTAQKLPQMVYRS